MTETCSFHRVFGELREKSGETRRLFIVNGTPRITHTYFQLSMQGPNSLYASNPKTKFAVRLIKLVRLTVLFHVERQRNAILLLSKVPVKKCKKSY